MYRLIYQKNMIPLKKKNKFDLRISFKCSLAKKLITSYPSISYNFSTKHFFMKRIIYIIYIYNINFRTLNFNVSQYD